jgi:hypothetical protein
VKRGQRLPDDRIPQPCEPPGLRERQRFDMPADRLDEHQLGHAREDIVATRARGARLAHGDVQQCGEPSARRFVARSRQVNGPGQGLQQRIERTFVATEETADNPRAVGSPPPRS